jgi:hypothetical protein
MSRRVFTNDQTFEALIQVSHFGPNDFEHCSATWRIRDGAGTDVARGALNPCRAATGRVTTLGTISLPLAKIGAPKQLNLEIAIDGTPFANDWDFWVYPAAGIDEAPSDVMIAHDLDGRTRQALDSGKKVLLLPGPQRIASNTFASFEPIFWNRITFPQQKQHTLGVLCDPAHPALSLFPTDAHSNWQWWDIQEHGKPMVLDGLPRELKPIVQMIDDWDQCRKLGLGFEARVGAGRLLMCSIDLENQLDARPAARQLRRSLIRYMTSDAFAPAVHVSPDQIRSLLREPGVMERLGAHVVHADSEQPDYEAAKVLDGDPNTFWHSAWDGAPGAHPHELVVEFRSPAAIRGCALLPRQDGNRNGWIKECEVFVSDDGREWGSPVATATLGSSPALQSIAFDRTVAPRFLKLVARSGFDEKPYASLAELRVIPASAP